jgi:hypothetical protein
VIREYDEKIKQGQFLCLTASYRDEKTSEANDFCLSCNLVNASMFVYQETLGQTFIRNSSTHQRDSMHLYDEIPNFL